MKLVRGIHKWDLAAVAVNGIIGAGIFGLPSRVFGLVGVYSLLAFLVCAVFVTLIILCFAEVGSRFRDSGGPYLYTREVFGSTIGFEVGWMMWLARLTGFAANCNLLIGYLGYFWPEVQQGWLRALMISGVVFALTAVNVVGVRDAAIVSNVFTVAKMIPLLLFIGIGAFYISSDNFAQPAAVPTLSSFSKAVLLLVYAFTGFEMAVIPAGEVQNPQRNLPMALLSAIAMVAVLYIAIQVVCIGTLPGLADSARPLADASKGFLSSAGGAIISIGALVSITGNLSVIILAGSRLPFAMAERADLPASLAITHARFRTPHLSILLSAAVMLLLTISWTFIEAVAISTIARLLAYAGTCASLIALRRNRQSAEEALFKVPAGSMVALFALGLTVWLLLNSNLSEARDAAIAGIIGLLIYAAYRSTRGNRAPAKT